MSGAPNCQHPPWSDIEKFAVSLAYNLEEALENWESVYRNVSGTPSRSLKAVQCMWLRLHPLLHSCPNTPLERELGIVLDELEWAL